MNFEKEKHSLISGQIQLLMISLLILCGGILTGSPLLGPPHKVNQAALILQEYSNLVQAYVTLHNQQEASLPRMKQTVEPSKITEHQHLLASKIVAVRATAVEGAIFTSDVKNALRPIIQRHFQGRFAQPTRLTLKEGNPVKMRLNVNDVYPEGVPWTTVPPTLILNLPRLPKEVEYRIVDRDLILWDVRANLVVDIFRQAIPSVSS
jgi:hypothetical protein